MVHQSNTKEISQTVLRPKFVGDIGEFDVFRTRRLSKFLEDAGGQGLQTFARLDGNQWVINGGKHGPPIVRDGTTRALICSALSVGLRNRVQQNRVVQSSWSLGKISIGISLAHLMRTKISRCSDIPESLVPVSSSTNCECRRGIYLVNLVTDRTCCP